MIEIGNPGFGYGAVEAESWGVLGRQGLLVLTSPLEDWPRTNRNNVAPTDTMPQASSTVHGLVQEAALEKNFLAVHLTRGRRY